MPVVWLGQSPPDEPEDEPLLLPVSSSSSAAPLEAPQPPAAARAAKTTMPSLTRLLRDVSFMGSLRDKSDPSVRPADTCVPGRRWPVVGRVTSQAARRGVSTGRSARLLRKHTPCQHIGWPRTIGLQLVPRWPRVGKLWKTGRSAGSIPSVSGCTQRKRPPVHGRRTIRTDRQSGHPTIRRSRGYLVASNRQCGLWRRQLGLRLRRLPTTGLHLARGPRWADGRALENPPALLGVREAGSGPGGSVDGRPVTAYLV